MSITAPALPDATAPAPDSLTAADFRAVCSSFVTGVTVVTARSADGVHGSTVNSFTSLSASPPQIIVCLARTTATLGHVLASGRLAVNILSHDQEQVARVFASKESDKLDRVEWTSGENGAPLLEGSMASLECTVMDVQPQATHMLIVCQVTRAVHEPDSAPLVFFRSTMSAGQALAAAV
ncbi:flavin reductase family protein [Herbiconiux daphne]|uniref:Flavin reductase family protein n=1 Tax=Herbiconiux daphne TaxID=2970914 RepID=A0ABT2H4A6_9MICO|nr:flavin reductase family protein [Herbiconiux daphne]MCS5734770.1 flavin reductase family protein [Herbiconiux daphne]